ncbi:MAG: NUDIX domain-containing protein [Nitrospinales bacterium]
MPRYQGDEILDWVDQQDNVIGQVSRKEIHAKSLLHRSVHILVFNSRGELFLQKRVMSKDENPGLWDSSAAGHIASGETYLVSAHRELKEELGIGASLKPFFRIAACAETLWEHVTAYRCVSDEPIVVDAEEISEGRFWRISEIEEVLAADPLQFTSVFRILIERVFNHGL